MRPNQHEPPRPKGRELEQEPNHLPYPSPTPSSAWNLQRAVLEAGTGVEGESGPWNPAANLLGSIFPGRPWGLGPAPADCEGGRESAS